MFRDFQISELCTLSNKVTLLIFCKYLISDACTCNRILLVITQDLYENCFENGERCYFDNSHFMTA